MNLFDVFIILVLGFRLIRGAIRGVVSVLSSTAGLSSGFYAAYRYYDVLVLKLPSWLSNYCYVSVISFLFIFFLVTLSIGFVSLIMNHMMNLNKIGKLSRTCGGFFGLLEGSLIAAVFILTLTTFFPRNIEFIIDSQLSPYLIKASETAANVIPYNMKLAIKTFKHQYWEYKCVKRN